MNMLRHYFYNFNFILCRLHASSIATLHMTFNFSFCIIWYRYFGVSWMCFLFAPTELPLCLYSMFSPKNLFRMSQFFLYLLYSKGLLSSSLWIILLEINNYRWINAIHPTTKVVGVLAGVLNQFLLVSLNLYSIAIHFLVNIFLNNVLLIKSQFLHQ